MGAIAASLRGSRETCPRPNSQASPKIPIVRFPRKFHLPLSPGRVRTRHGDAFRPWPTSDSGFKSILEKSPASCAPMPYADDEPSARVSRFSRCPRPPPVSKYFPSGIVERQFDGPLPNIPGDDKALDIKRGGGDSASSALNAGRCRFPG